MSLVVSTPTDREIVLTRAFAAPRALVFDAYSKPELLMRWYGARGWNLVGCEIELREDGRYRFESRGPGGETMVQSGIIQLVQPPARLVFTERFDDQSYPGETVIIHEFDEESDQTTVTTTVRYATAEDRDIAMRYPMVRGITESGDRLTAILTELTERNQP